MRTVLCLVVLGLAAPARGQGPTVSVKDHNDGLSFYAGDPRELVTYYRTTGYARPVFFPVYAPDSAPLTRSWPIDKSKAGESTDHIHQKSIWFTHGDVIPEGIELKDRIKGVDGVDFWSEAKGHGTIVCVGVEAPKVDGDRVTVRTKNEWQTADGKKIMDENRVVHVYNLGRARLIVIDAELHAGVCPIIFGDTKEGAMGVRVNDLIRADKVGKGKIENADGKVGEKECWGQYSAWCDYSGPVDGKTVGIAVFDDPRNPHKAAWHVRGYGLMAANPFGRIKAAFPATKGNTALVRLAQGERVRFRYGVLLHDGDAESGRVAEHYQRFVGLREKE